MKKNKQNKTIQALESELKATELKSRKLYDQVRHRRRCAALQVTDHAIVRYLERHKGIDIEAIKNELYTNQVMTLYHQLGDGTFPLGHGTTRVVVKSGVIITVIN